MENIALNELLQRIPGLLNDAMHRIVQSVNHAVVLTYFEIGRMIVEEEQSGNVRADYRMQLLKTLSVKLTINFGKGFSKRNLEQMRQFYLVYSKAQTLSALFENHQEAAVTFQLSWSHYLKLMRIDDNSERRLYEIESVKNNWSLRELNRQYDFALFTRLSLTRDRGQVLKLSKEANSICTTGRYESFYK